MSSPLLRRVFVPAVLTALSLFASPLVRTAQAQEDKIYAITELSNPPKLSSSMAASRLIQESYPEDLKRRGVGGMVEVQFVVDSKGKVDPASILIVDATQTALGEAAKKVVSKLDFSPGKLNGTSVKSQVVLPIIYKAN